MTLLRQAKVDKIADSIPEQEVQGDADADLLVVAGVVTYGHLYSAVEHMRKNGRKWHSLTSSTSTRCRRIQPT